MHLVRRHSPRSHTCTHARTHPGSSQEDILSAFRTLAGGETISSEQISLHFVTDDMSAYMLTHMPKKGEAYAYEPFTVAIFER